MDEQVTNKGFLPNPTVEQLLSCEVKFKSSWPENESNVQKICQGMMVFSMIRLGIKMKMIQNVKCEPMLNMVEKREVN